MDVDASKDRGSRLPTLVLAALAVTLAAFWQTWLAFVGLWQWEGTNTHGWVIFALVLWLVWQERDALTRTRGGLEVLALPTAGLSLLWMVALVMDIQLGHTGALPLVLLGWVGVALGLPALLRLAPFAAAFYLAVPLWGVFTRPLQTLTVLVSGTLVKLVGVEAVIEGDTITIQYGTFLVEGSCAGLGYFVVGLVVGTLYAFLFVPRWRGRIAVVALAGGMAILSNWLRVTSLILIGEYTQMEAPLIRSHGTYGWILFSVMLVPFFFLAHQIERWDRRAKRREEEGAMSQERTPPPTPDPGAPRRAWLATGAALVGPALAGVLSLLPAGAQEPGSFTSTEGWTPVASAEAPPLPWTVDFQGVDARESGAFRRDSALVLTQRLVYEEQQQGRELVNSLNRIAPDSLLINERTVGPLDRRGRSVREAWIRTGERETALAWYWYRVADANTASPSRAKLLELWGFLTRKPRAELLVASAPCREDDCRPAAELLFEFVTGQELPAAPPDTTTAGAPEVDDPDPAQGGTENP